jgi:L-amino acid N-acyltransferase YncA
VKLRLATVADAPGLLAIYGPYVEDTAITFETAVPTAEEMAERIRATMPAHPWLVAVDGDEVVGYAYAHLFAPRAAYRWAAETSVYVGSGTHRRGAGRRLYRALVELLAVQGYREALAGITIPNVASVALHENMGFARVATYERVGWKLGSWHDVGWWQRRLGGDGSEPAAPMAIDEIDPARLEGLLRSPAIAPFAPIIQ